LLEEIRRAWEAGNPIQTLWDVAGNLNVVMTSPRKWSRKKFGGVTSKLEKLRKHMEDLRGQDPRVCNSEVVSLRQRMDELLYHKEMMWLQ
jgi:hypothetical protein